MEGRNYTITIKTDSLTEKRSPIATDNPKQSVKEQKKIEGRYSNALAHIFSYSAVKSYATQIINHEVSLVQLRTGSNEWQQRANDINQTVQQGVGLIESTVTGAAVGGWVGAVVGLATSLMNTLVSYVRQAETLNIKNSIENVSIGMNIVRAGANGSRR